MAGTFVIQKEAINTASGWSAGWVPLEMPPISGLITSGGGMPLLSNQGLVLTANTGTTVTQGDGTLKIRVEYQIIDIATLATAVT